MTAPLDLAARIARAVLRDLPSAAGRDYAWVCALLERSGLPRGVIALLALEAAMGTAPGTPCLAAWRQLLGAALGGDPVATHLRESLALALDLRSALRERRPDSDCSLGDGSEAVRVIVSEAQRAVRYAEALARRRPNCLLVGG
ncbi:MAG: hypothetical protein RMM58_13870 [Chloroflexota bacterium]|nr:hypothetical protein [Dehalococcoidia bacterium]MDW8254959.1 hypothetical protein [Chloroflexota bacterium]